MSEQIKVYPPRKLKEMDNKIDKLTKVYDRAKGKLVGAQLEAQKLLSETKLRCTTQIANGTGCGALTKIKDLTYLQSFSYDPNTGSPNGGFEYESEGGFRCPKCGKENRLYLNKEIGHLKSCFKDVEEVRPKRIMGYH